MEANRKAIKNLHLQLEEYNYEIWDKMKQVENVVLKMERDELQKRKYHCTGTNKPEIKCKFAEINQ